MLLTGEVVAVYAQDLIVPPSNSWPVVLRTYVPDGAVVKKYTGPVSARMLEEDIAAAGGPAVG